jgi:uncharacterized protein YbjT (DUF2867 family)
VSPQERPRNLVEQIEHADQVGLDAFGVGEQHPGLGDEVVEADLNRPETLTAGFRSAHGVFLVTNFWEKDADEGKQAATAVRAALDAGAKHFIWSTLPDVEAISGGKFKVAPFTGKAKVDRIVMEAGFAYYTFVIAPFYYQNLLGVLAPQEQPNGSLGWALPLRSGRELHSYGRHSRIRQHRCGVPRRYRRD